MSKDNKNNAMMASMTAVGLMFVTLGLTLFNQNATAQGMMILAGIVFIVGGIATGFRRTK
jgi:hypothetical protein